MSTNKIVFFETNVIFKCRNRCIHKDKLHGAVYGTTTLSMETIFLGLKLCFIGTSEVTFQQDGTICHTCGATIEKKKKVSEKIIHIKFLARVNKLTSLHQLEANIREFIFKNIFLSFLFGYPCDHFIGFIDLVKEHTLF